jgi:hypothetical protein
MYVFFAIGFTVNKYLNLVRCCGRAGLINSKPKPEIKIPVAEDKLWLRPPAAPTLDAFCLKKVQNC